MPPRAVSIVVPNFNGEKLLPEFLPSVLAAAGRYAGPSEVVLADDGSRDGSRAVIEAFARSDPRVRPVFAERNRGFPAACNLGAEAARHEILFFLNNDVALPPGYFDRFSAPFDDPAVFAVCPAGYRLGSGEQIDGIKTLDFRRGFLRFTGNVLNDAVAASGLPAPRPSWGFQGAYFFIRADRFRELGGFDTVYAPYLFEESDLAYRGLKRGWTIVYDGDAVAHHRLSATIGSDKVSPRVRRIARRNRLILHWKNLHSPGLFARHVLGLASRLAVLDLAEWRAVVDALGMWAEIAPRRRAERRAAVVSDAALLARAAADLARYRQRGGAA